MKYLMIALAVLIILVAIFFIRGLLTPSVSYESQFTIDRPASHVWEVMQDESKLPEWIEGFKRTELVSGTAGQVGAVSNVYVESKGSESKMVETIKEIIPHKKMAMHFNLEGFMGMEYEMHLEEQGGETVVTSKTVTRGQGLIGKSMVAWMQGGMKKQEDKNMKSLKRLVERN